LLAIALPAFCLAFCLPVADLPFLFLGLDTIKLREGERH
jgi:hypothetical protein